MWTVIRWGRRMLQKLAGSGRLNVLAAEGLIGTSDDAHELFAGLSVVRYRWRRDLLSGYVLSPRAFETRVLSALRYVAARDGDVLVAVPLRGELLEGRPDGPTRASRPDVMPRWPPLVTRRRRYGRLGLGAGGRIESHTHWANRLSGS